MSEPRNRVFGDPPGPGECKLKIKSDGTAYGTRILIVDDAGVERHLLGAVAASWKIAVGDELAIACVRVNESEVEIEAESVEARPADEEPKP